MPLRAENKLRVDFLDKRLKARRGMGRVKGDEGASRFQHGQEGYEVPHLEAESLVSR